MSTAIKCDCGHKSCKAWHVSPEADVQGVRFTQEEALAVAALLNSMRDPGETPKHGDIYRHFKGGEYRVLGLAFDVTSGDRDATMVVIYQRFDSAEEVYVRQLEQFMKTVRVGNSTVRRFSRIPES